MIVRRNIIVLVDHRSVSIQNEMTSLESVHGVKTPTENLVGFIC